jgi:hypothetical protein
MQLYECVVRGQRTGAQQKQQRVIETDHIITTYSHTTHPQLPLMNALGSVILSKSRPENREHA